MRERLVQHILFSSFPIQQYLLWLDFFLLLCYVNWQPSDLSHFKSRVATHPIPNKSYMFIPV